MTALILPPGSMGFDTAGVPDYAEAKADGNDFASLYLVGRYAATAQMVADCLGAGLPIQWNHERSPGLALGGAAAGYRAAQEAIQAAEAFGWVKGETPLIFSATDETIALQDFGTCDDFYMEVDGVCGWSGAYGPAEYLRHWWAVNPNLRYVYWHWAGDHAIPEHWTNVQQLLAQRIYGRALCDMNWAITPLAVWAGPGSGKVVDDMTEFRHGSQGDVYELSNGFKWPVSGPYFYNALNGCLYGEAPPNPRPDGGGTISYPADDGVLAGIPTGSFGGGFSGTLRLTLEGTATPA